MRAILYVVELMIRVLAFMSIFHGAVLLGFTGSLDPHVSGITSSSLVSYFRLLKR